MPEALHIHEPEHPGFFRHSLEGRKVGIDGDRSPAGVSQEFSNTHDVMPAPSTPATIPRKEAMVCRLRGEFRESR